MSIAVMARVWKDYPGVGGSELLALLALADWSDDDGRCWPAMNSIAAKTRLSRSQAQRVVHGLIADGYLFVIGNADGGKPGATRQYQINLDAMTGRMDATPTGRTDAMGSANATGRTHAQDGSYGRAETGRTDATQTIIKTINEPSTTSHMPAAEGGTLLPSLSDGHSQPLNTPPPAGQTREQAIAVWLRKTEKSRGKFVTATSSDTRIQAWAERGVTDAQLGEAYELALAERTKTGDSSPINPGFLDIFVAKLVLIPNVGTSVLNRLPATHALSRALAWSSIVAKGTELGLTQGETEQNQAFKARVYAAAGVIQADVDKLRADLPTQRLQAA